LVLLVLVLPALIRMKDHVRTIRYDFEWRFQDRSYHGQDSPAEDDVIDQIVVMKIPNRCEIHLLAKQAERGYSIHLFRVWLFRIKVLL